jgi:hypothetical protein
MLPVQRQRATTADRLVIDMRCEHQHTLWPSIEGGQRQAVATEQQAQRAFGDEA